MKREQFINGVTFTIGQSPYLWTYESYTSDNGRVVDMISARLHRAHINISKRGICLWNFCGDTYLESKVIPFSELQLVNAPVIA
jgi:hypothetical protein